MGESRAIEIGHIFCLGTKYSKMMNFRVSNVNGNMIHPYMGCFGIGISRLVAAIIESNSDDKGIIWPKEISPFEVGIINLRPDNIHCYHLSESIFTILKKNNVEVLYDDKVANPGVKFATMDLI